MRWTAAIALALILSSALALGAVRRIADPRPVFCGWADEFSEFMPGVRLHGLPLWNLDADIRSNFFKSLFYSPHGLGDAGFYYAASGALYGLGLSISERHLWLAGAVTNALLIVAVAGFALRVARSATMASVTTIFIALSPLYVFVSQTAFARVTFVPLLHMLALLLAALAHHRPGWTPRVALFAVAFLIELTDGFYFGPVLLVFLFLLQDGSLGDRIRGALRDRTWWSAAAAVFAGLAFDIALGALAAAHNTSLTLFGYVRIRLGYGGLLSAMDLFKLWMDAFAKYLPAAGPFVVLPAWLLAIRYAWSDPVAGALATWLAIASAGVIRYYANAPGPTIPIVGGLTASPLALPSYLVVGWACGRLLQARAVPFLRALGIVMAAAATIPLAARLITDRFDVDLIVKNPMYLADLDKCLVIKAAGVYVREQAIPGDTVFHLSGNRVLGAFGEFYYGLGYVGNNHTGERNRIVDFGTEVVGKRYTPEQLARAYAVPHFTYYVEFLPTTDPFVADAVARLQTQGARAAVEIRDRDRLLGRIWRFDGAGTELIDLAEVPARWDRVGSLRQLIRQSVAGTFYHFGPSWPAVPD